MIAGSRRAIAVSYCDSVEPVKIEKGYRVRIRVHLAIAGGDTIEKCVVEYVQGGGTMLPGLEEVLLGKEQGAKLEGTLPAKAAFGNPSMHPVKKIPRAEFPKDAQLKAGEKFAAKGANGQDVVMVVEKVSDKEVEVALVHPLADKDIKYEVEVLSVKELKAPPPIPVAALELEEAPE